MDLVGGDTAYRNVVFRLHPGSERTAKQLLGIWDGCRFAWNLIKEAYEIQYVHACGRPIDSPSFFTLGKAFRQLWDDVPWLRDLPYAVVRYALKYQAEAWQGFLDGERGYPKWKNRFGDPSFTIPDNVRIRDGRLAVPKVGRLRISRRGENPYADERPVKAVIKRVGRRWYATVTYKLQGWVAPDNGGCIGLDCNVRQVADSEGEIHRLPNLAHLEAKERRHRRALSRKKKGSKRRANARRKVTRAARRVRMARRNWQHHVSRRIVRKAGTVVVEALNTRGMTSSATGTVDRPGRNVKAKAGLNREILATGWRALCSMLEYKAKELIAVNPAYTSQTCSACGVADPGSRRSQAEFRCVACGHAQNADINAARNILASGTGATARRGAFTLVTPVNREMDTGRAAG